MKIDRELERASELFMKREFQKALDIFLTILRYDPSNEAAKLGVLLCDLSDEDVEEAISLFDYYIILKMENEKEPERVVMELIEEIDEAESEIASFLANEERLLEGISYKDFKKIVEDRGSFKRAFEDIMHSTRVVITKKSDFFDFLENLVENGYNEMALSYLEDASKLYPADEHLYHFVERLHKKESK